MSLDGIWPSWAGLPEPSGTARLTRQAHLETLLREKLAAPGTDGAAPIDRRVEAFLTSHLAEVRGGKAVKLPPKISLQQYGMARVMALPADGDAYHSPLIRSYRCLNGVLHNPASDKRTTKGSFHVADGGYPVADDKKIVPLAAFNRMLDIALEEAPDWLLEVPFTVHDKAPQKAWVALMLRPLVCPEVPPHTTEKRMEIRVLAPASMAANVDFLESVFGNAGEATLPENDAALDAEHWSGHTGCIIHAPHILKTRKADLGLPHWDDATERQRRDGMAWKDPQELYNNGQPFKICTRTIHGFVTMLSDNYFGYSKKEVKTQSSYACNLFGTEEEHAGGALAFASRSWGGKFREDYRVLRQNHHFGAALEPYSFEDAMKLLEGDVIMRDAEGYAVDRTFPDVFYVPEDAEASTATGKISWSGGELFLTPGAVYIHPSGYQVSLEKRLGKTGWHIRGTVAEPVTCHKPCTVSGGGKSEISKLLSDMISFGHARMDDAKVDLSYVDMILKRDYSDRFIDKSKVSHPILDKKVSLGTVIDMLTVADDHAPDYNRWVETIPRHIRTLVFLVKHVYQPAWGSDWRSHFGVEMVDGAEGHIVHVDGKPVVTQYLRVGRTKDGIEHKLQLRQDFVPAQKIQTEDDITASIVVPRGQLEHLSTGVANPSLKMLRNCELRLFQRPDDAIIRGCDTTAEEDLAKDGNLMCNFEPLTGKEADIVTKQPVAFEEFTEAMQKRLKTAAVETDKYVVSSNHFRIVSGKPTANPRYLQVRTDFGLARERHVARVAARLRRRIPAGKPVHFPVNGVLPGRRNNPPDTLLDGTPIRPLSVFNPIHYQELPELFMEFTSSLTGRSPSTTGAGSEGALTKGPFNALRFTADLNATLVGMILTGYAGYSTSAGYIGKRQVDHDISLLIPELWCRMSEEERDPSYLIKTGCLEKVNDIELNDRRVIASRLGYRITSRFVNRFLVRIFESPDAVFDDSVLRPETQDMLMFVDGVNNIVEAQARTAKAYIADGSIHDACPPLRAILYCMAEGRTPEGLTIESPEVRALFKREELLASSWYRERLVAKQRQEVARLSRSISSLRDFLKQPENAADAERLSIAGRLSVAEKQLEVASSAAFVDSLVGTVGVDPTLLVP